MTESPVKARKPVRHVSVWYVGIVAFLAVLAGMFGMAVFISQVSKSRSADTCRVVTAQLDVFKETPPTTPAGVKVRNAWQGLYHSLHCDEVIHDE